MTGTTVQIRYKKYKDKLDLTGKDIISISTRNAATGKSGTRADAMKLFPFLLDPNEMDLTEFSTESLTALGGNEIADEVHDFTNVQQGFIKISRLMLREGEVIELQLGEWKETASSNKQTGCLTVVLLMLVIVLSLVP